jgi:hypothetical protein
MLALMNNVNGAKDQASTFFNTPWQRTDLLTVGSDINQWLEDSVERMLTRIEEQPSLRLRQVVSVSFTAAVAGYRRGGSYIPLPEKIAGKECCININLGRYSPENKHGCNKQTFEKYKDSCFRFSVLAGLHPVESHAEEARHYIDHVPELNMDGIEEPVAITDVPRFMKQNPTISVNVHGWTEKKGVHNLHITHKSDMKENHVRLLLLQDPKDQEVWHYVLLKHLDRLMNTNTASNHHKRFYCGSCLWPLSSPELLAKHRELPCGETRVEMSEEGKNDIRFKNLSRSLKAPAIIYADFEALTTQLQTDESMKTVREQHHKAIAAELRVVVAQEVPTRAKFEKTETFVGTQCVQQFISAVHKNAVELIDNVIKHIEPMTDVDEEAFKVAKQCYICKRVFRPKRRGDFSKKEENLKKVRDHCHMTGKYRGPACNDCNLNKRTNEEVCVVFHNLRGYDSHLMMRDLGIYINQLNLGGQWESRIETVANTIEKYMSLSWFLSCATGEVTTEGKPVKKHYKIRFLDSLQHLACSLDSLAKILQPEDLVYTRQAFGENADLMSRKGVFPYDWYNDESKNACTELPTKEQFSSRLTGLTITDGEYAHAQNVWKTMKCKTFEDYMRIYLATDVALLADVFERYRATSLKSFGLDPSHYMTCPSLSWDSCIKMATDTGTKLENMTDYDQHLFIERATRGGKVMISRKYAKADNKYIRKDATEKAGDSYIEYYDANNLYGKAMSEKLPTGDYKWDPEAPAVEELMAFHADGDRGLFVDCDLDYPEHLHDLHNDYPMAVQKMLVTDEMLSPFTRTLGTATGRTPDKVEKLIPNLMNKKNYVCHIKNFQYYVKAGLVPTKIHRVLSFKQEAWVKKYVDFNTQMRAKATTKFEQEFHKLVVNSFFGKTMENVRNRITVDRLGLGLEGAFW